jgi:hypothetical protein
VAQGVGPEFKPQYGKKKKKNIRSLYGLDTLCFQNLDVSKGLILTQD